MNNPMNQPVHEDVEGIRSLYNRPGFLLRRAHQISVSLFMEATAELGVTTTQYGVLLILHHFEGLDQISLAKKVGLDRSTTGLVLKKLEQKGLVVRTNDPGDLRRKIIVLTARGERMLDKLTGPAANAQAAALEPFSEQEATQFKDLLKRFVEFYNASTRAPIIEDGDVV
jgi:DNA-binding MarR family transcriptional regulator